MSSANGYVPTTPLSAVVSSILSQDVISSGRVVLDASSITPLAVFVNPAGPVAEALVVQAGVNGGPAALAHVVRDTATDAGWSLQLPVAGAIPREVAAGSAYASQAWGFYQDGTTTWSMQLGSDGNWLPAVDLQGLVTNLRVTYSPLGQLVMYGAIGGKLAVVWQEASDFSLQTITGTTVESAFQLVMVDESNWNLLANVSGVPTVYTGQLGVTQAASSAPLGGWTGTLQDIALGYYYQAKNSSTFLLIDDQDNLYVHLLGSSAPVLIEGLPTSSATGFVDNNNALHVYSIDPTNVVWVTHSDPTTPWHADGSPNFTPSVPIAKGISTMSADINRADAPSLFAIDTTANALRLHKQDAQTTMWRNTPVHVSMGGQPVEVTRFRSEVAILDANGILQPNMQVNVTLGPNTTAVDLCVQGRTVPTSTLSATTPVTMTTDATGRVTIAVLATNLSAPTLVVSADGLDPVTLNSAQALHNYLAGNGTLNPTNPTSSGGPLPVFDAAGTTLTNAQVNGQPLAQPNGATLPPQVAASCATSIHTCAAAGLATQSPSGAGLTVMSFLDPTGPATKSFADVAAVDDYFMNLYGTSLTELHVASFWSGLGDLWSGIESGVVAIGHVVVSAANGLVSIVGTIVQGITRAFVATIHGIEDAAHAIAGVFKAIVADIEMVIDWLKALFDFGAIWRTKKQFDSALSLLPAFIGQLAQQVDTDVVNWLAAQKADVDQAFTTVIKSFGGQGFSSFSGWQTPGVPSRKPIAGQAAPSDFTNNVHHNWLQDKMASGAPATVPISGNATNWETAWTKFSATFSNVEPQLTAALTSFGTAVASLIENPATLGTQGVATFLTAAQAIVDAAFDVASAIVLALGDLAAMAMDALSSMLNTTIDSAFLDRLWKWIATLGGGGDDELTIGGIITLVAAFPATIIYKLINGVDTEPFPDSAIATDGLTSGGPYSTASPILASILEILSVVPALIGKLTSPQTPWWLSGLSAACTALIYYFRGLPDLPSISWDGQVAIVASALLLLPGAYLVWQSISTALQKASPGFGLMQIYYSGQSLYGTVALALAIYATSLGIGGKDEQAENFLFSLPHLFSFLQIVPDFYSTAAVCVFTFAGHVGGGVIELMDAT